jgi:hypothetical protein
MPQYPVKDRIVHPTHIPFGGADSAARYGKHSGDDSANPIQTPVYAPATGTVTGYTWGTYHGNVVEIFDGQYYPHVFHLARLNVTPGQRVNQGDLVGWSGSTGQGVTGPHIHFGVSKVSVPNARSFNDFIDPLAYVNQQGGSMATSPGLVRNMYRYVGGREASDQDVAFHTANSSPDSLMDGFIRNNDLALVGARQMIDKLNGMVTAKDAEIASLKAQLAAKPNTPPPTTHSNPQDTADATKWRSYKALRKELIQ